MPDNFSLLLKKKNLLGAKHFMSVGTAEAVLFLSRKEQGSRSLEQPPCC